MPRAQILNAEATGPSVPAIMGNAEATSHHRLVQVSILCNWQQSTLRGSSRMVEIFLFIWFAGLRPGRIIGLRSSGAIFVVPGLARLLFGIARGAAGW